MTVTAAFAADANQAPPDLTLLMSRGEYLALDGLASCFAPFLAAIDWRGDARAIAEAMPHFAAGIDRVDFQNMLARLGLTPKSGRIAIDRSLEMFAPCVLMPHGAAPLVVLRAAAGRARVFDSGSKTTREIDLDAHADADRHPAIFLSDASERAKPDLSQPWLAHVLRRFKRLIVLALFLTFWMSLLALVAPIGMMSLYIAVLPHDAGGMIPYISAAVLICLLAEAGLRYLRSALQAYVAGRIDYLVSTAAFEQVMRLPSAMTAGATIGDQSARLRGFQSLRDVFVSPMTSLALELPFLPIYVVALAIIAGSVAFVPVVALLIYMALGLIFLRSVKRRSAEAARKRAERQVFLVEMLRQMGTIKQLGAEYRWQERFRTLSGRAAGASFEAAQAGLLLQDLSHMVMVAAGIATMGLAVYNSIEGTMNAGALIAVMALTWRALSPIQGGLRLVMSLERVWEAGRQLNALMRIPPEATGQDSNLERKISDGAIRFKNVSMRYGRSNEPALLGVNLDIPVGEFVAIVGGSGSGKSSLLKALLRIYDPQAGAIFIDDVDIRQAAPAELRRSIGYVPQNPTLLYGTIAQNLRLFKPSASLDDLRHACANVGVLDAINALPEGFNSRFGDQTIRRLPPGFINCLTLAGVLLRKPVILLLDEAHDGFDMETEKQFLACIERLRGQVTVLLTTHRPSHKRIADRVVVLENGRVVSDGPPENPAPRPSPIAPEPIVSKPTISEPSTARVEEVGA